MTSPTQEKDMTDTTKERDELEKLLEEIDNARDRQFVQVMMFPYQWERLKALIEAQQGEYNAGIEDAAKVAESHSFVDDCGCFCTAKVLRKKISNEIRALKRTKGEGCGT